MKKTLSVFALGLAVSAASAHAGIDDRRPASTRRAVPAVRGVGPAAAAMLAAIPTPGDTRPSLSVSSLIASLDALGDSYTQLIAAAEMHACEHACDAQVAAIDALAASKPAALRPPRLVPPEDERVGHTACSEMDGVADARPSGGDLLPLGTYLMAQLETRSGVDLSAASAEAQLLGLINNAQQAALRFRRDAVRILAGSNYRYERNPFEVVEAVAAPSPASLAASPVQARALLDEYHAYDLTLNDRLWLSRARSTVCEAAGDSFGCTPVRGHSALPVATAADSLDEYVRESDSLCGIGSRTAVRPKLAFPSERPPVCGYVIARLPVDHTLTSLPAAPQTAATFVDADPSVLFGPHVAPPLDLHLRGLSWVAQDCSNNWRNRRAAWAAAIDRLSPMIPVAEAHEVDASNPPKLDDATSMLRGLAAVTLERLSESLATASLYAGAASEALGGPADAKFAGRAALKR